MRPYCPEHVVFVRTVLCGVALMPSLVLSLHTSNKGWQGFVGGVGVWGMVCAVYDASVQMIR